MGKDRNGTFVQIFIKKLTIVHVSADVIATFLKKMFLFCFWEKSYLVHKFSYDLDLILKFSI
jgi:hypothetical protein